MADTNGTGMRGEAIFMTRISQGNLFNVYFLGDKAPVVDFLVEINDAATPYAFMVQVKSTEKGYNGDGNLKVYVTIAKYKELLNRPLPTYIAGVDVNTETVYLCSAFSDKTHLKSMPVNHRLKFTSKAKTQKTLYLLKQDVINYWQGGKIKSYKKKYKSSL